MFKYLEYFIILTVIHAKEVDWEDRYVEKENIVKKLPFLQKKKKKNMIEDLYRCGLLEKRVESRYYGGKECIQISYMLTLESREFVEDANIIQFEKAIKPLLEEGE